VAFEHGEEHGLAAPTFVGRQSYRVPWFSSLTLNRIPQKRYSKHFESIPIEQTVFPTLPAEPRSMDVYEIAVNFQDPLHQGDRRKKSQQCILINPPYRFLTNSTSAEGFKTTKKTQGISELLSQWINFTWQAWLELGPMPALPSPRAKHSLVRSQGWRDRACRICKTQMVTGHWPPITELPEASISNFCILGWYPQNINK
jgi:hypothetical protein